MEQHSHTPWIIGLVICLIVGLGAGASVGIMVGRQQKVPTKIVKQSAADGVNINDVKIVPAKDLADNLANLPEASTYLSLFKAADMTDLLHGVGPYTILLPLNNVFKGLNQDQLTALQNKKNQSNLRDLLLANILPGTVTAAQIRVKAARNQTVQNMLGKDIILKIDNKKLIVVNSNNKADGGELKPNDAIAANGIIQVSSQLIVPGYIKLELAKK